MTTARQQSPSNYSYRLSILIPMLNEMSSILFILNKVKKALVDENYQIIVVDDGSTDQSAEEVEKFIALNPKLAIQLVRQENQGKGGAIRTAIAQASGEILVVQDADLEYDPNDILSLLPPFSENKKVVYGSRNLNKKEREHSTLLFYWGGLVVTYFTNFLFGSKLTDEATGYKLFHASIFQDLSFTHNDFAWEPEITAKILKRKIEIVEKPITYKPRSVTEGKKISWRDGVKALWVLLSERFKR